MSREDRRFTKIAISRGYLTEEGAARALRVATVRRVPVAEVLLDEGVLSSRRVKRIQNHVRYRTMRREDKRYAELAVRRRMVTETQAKQALNEQRKRFEGDRERVRLGNLLIEQSLITIDEDETLLARLGSGVRKITTATVEVDYVSQLGQHASSVNQTPLHESSAMAAIVDANAAEDSTPSYREIDLAMERIAQLQRVQADMSRSDVIAPDSAEDYENAIRCLARRRISPQAAKETSEDQLEQEIANDLRTRAPKKKPRSKSTGKLRVLFGLGAAS
jgi:hypothetical protein